MNDNEPQPQVENTNNEQSIEPMSDNDLMNSIFQLAKETEKPVRKTKKQEKTEEGRNIIRDRLKNAREKKKSMADRLQELERLLNEKNNNQQEQKAPEQKAPEPKAPEQIQVIAPEPKAPEQKAPEQKEPEQIQVIAPEPLPVVDPTPLSVVEPPRELTKEEKKKLLLEQTRREWVKKHFRI